MKIRPVGAELFHADRRTHDKLIFAFSNYANAPKNCLNTFQCNVLMTKETQQFL